MQFLAFVLSDLVWRLILCYGKEKGVNHAIGVAFTTFTNVATMSKPRVKQHLPNMRIPPVVGTGLWVDFDPKVVMTAFKNFRNSKILIQGNANQVLSKFLESLVKSIFIIFAFTLAEAYQTVTIAAKE